MTDAQIVQLYWERDESAITVTNETYGGRLRHLAVRLLRVVEDGEECVNDTYWRTWNSIPPTRPLHLFAYLAKICRRLALNRLEKQSAAKRSAVVVELTQELENCLPVSDNGTMDSAELGEILSAFLRELPPDARRIFLLRYWHARSVREIAEECRVSESKVKTTLFRARIRLREHLEKEGITV